MACHCAPFGAYCMRLRHINALRRLANAGQKDDTRAGDGQHDGQPQLLHRLEDKFARRRHTRIAALIGTVLLNVLRSIDADEVDLRPRQVIKVARRHQMLLYLVVIHLAGGVLVREEIDAAALCGGELELRKIVAQLVHGVERAKDHTLVILVATAQHGLWRSQGGDQP